MRCSTNDLNSEASQIWLCYARYYYFLFAFMLVRVVLQSWSHSQLFWLTNMWLWIPKCNEPQFQLNGPGCHRCCAKRLHFYRQQQTVKKRKKNIGLYLKKKKKCWLLLKKKTINIKRLNAECANGNLVFKEAD